VVCLRCGYCCKYLSVVVVVDPERGLIEDNLLFHKGNGKRCKHLEGNKPGKYRCKVHDCPWYVDSPCSRHGQLEKGNSNCRIGEAILAGKAPWYFKGESWGKKKSHIQKKK